MDISENVLRIWKCAKRNKQALTSGESEVGMWIWSRLVLCWAGQRDINDSWSRLSFTRARKAPSLAHLKSSPSCPQHCRSTETKSMEQGVNTRQEDKCVVLRALPHSSPLWLWFPWAPSAHLFMVYAAQEGCVVRSRESPSTNIHVRTLSEFHPRNSS